MTYRQLSRAAWAAVFAVGDLVVDLAEDLAVSALAFGEDVRAGLEDVAADARHAWRAAA